MLPAPAALAIDRERLVARAAHERLAVGRQGNRTHHTGVRTKHRDRLRGGLGAALQIPHTHLAVDAPGEQLHVARVVRLADVPAQRTDHTSVPGKDVRHEPAHKVVHLHAPVRPAERHETRRGVHGQERDGRIVRARDAPYERKVGQRIDVHGQRARDRHKVRVVGRERQAADLGTVLRKRIEKRTPGKRCTTRVVRDSTTSTSVPNVVTHHAPSCVTATAPPV